MEPSAANHVFYIPELLYLIVQELETPRDLAGMARVATPSHLPSVKALWSGTSPRIDLGSNTFCHLVQLLPQDLVQKMKGKTVWQFCRSPLPSDWARLRHYSTHVKAFTIKPSNYSSDIFSYFNTAESNLFPQLHKIGISDDASFPSIDWTMLVAPTLRDLQLTGSDPWSSRSDPHHLASFCQQLSHCAPQLQCLALPITIMPGILSNDVENVILAAVESLTALTEFRWEWDRQLSRKVIKFMATHPHLTKVCFGRVEEQAEDLGGMERSFPCLAKLELSGTGVGMESVLKRLTHPESLTSIAFEYTQLPRRDSDYLALSLIPQATDITTISLTFLSDSLPWGSFAFDKLSPILDCKKITSFTLLSTPTVDGLGDEAVRAMAGSWPELEEIILDVNLSDQDERHPTPTPLGLATLANFCPRLQRLTMSIRFTCCEYYRACGDYMDAPDRDSRTLEYLDLGYSRWYDDWECKAHIHPEATARILRDVWPGLKSEKVRVVIPSSGFPPEQHLLDKWQRIKQCLTHMEEQKVIAWRDSAYCALRRERDMLEKECTRLRRELAEVQRRSTGSQQMPREASGLSK